MDGVRAGWVGLWLAAVAVVVVGAQPYAGGWNDGSRLATVEAIVDQGTLAIDATTFTRPVDPNETHAPYRDPACFERGTCDKLFVAGRYYSDKPAVVSYLMAGLYGLWRLLGGPAAAARPDLFCLLMTWGASGLAFLASLACLARTTVKLELAPAHRLLVTASLAASTIAVVYTRHVNNHILLLAVASGIVLHLVPDAFERQRGALRTWRWPALGGLAGLGYVLDLGLGPALLASVALATGWCTRSFAWVALGAAPAVGAHHAINYAIGGSIRPMNAIPEHLQWDGSPFDASNLTGAARNAPTRAVVYGLSLLFGKHGFVGHDLPLLLAFGGGVWVWRRRPEARPDLAFAALWCVGGWAAYALYSNNYAGQCCSIRWFVPFLAPAYLAISWALRARPEWAADLAVLSLCGAVTTFALWPRGPWSNKATLVYWPAQALALVGLWVLWRRRRHASSVVVATPAPLARAA